MDRRIQGPARGWPRARGEDARSMRTGDLLSYAAAGCPAMQPKRCVRNHRRVQFSTSLHHGASMSLFQKAKTIASCYSDADIRTKLQEDHKIFKELTKEACEGSTPAARTAAFKKLKPLLVAHARAEEAVVYAAMVKVRKSPDSRDYGNEGFVEHSL